MESGDKEDAGTKKITNFEWWARVFPLLNFLKGYNGKKLIGDCIAGLTVALTVIPQSMAIAALGGLPPQYGLYSAMMSSTLYVITGSTAFVSIGPTIVLAILIYPLVQEFGHEIAVLLCFFSGCVLLFIVVFRLVFIINFISAPALAGFLSAAGLTVIAGQIPPLLGFSGGGSTFLDYCIKIVKNCSDIRLWDSVLGISCMAVIISIERVNAWAERNSDRFVLTAGKVFRTVITYCSLGRNAIVVILSTALAATLTAEGEEPPFYVTGDIDGGLPKLSLPPFTIYRGNETLSFGATMSELVPSLMIPIVVIIETTGSIHALSFGTAVNMKREILANGLCSIATSFCSSAMPVASSVTRSAINLKSGVQTPLGGLVTGSLVLMSLVFLTPVLKFLPKATLAAVVICAIAFLVQIHRRHAQFWRTKRTDLIPLYVAFLGCLLLGLDNGMLLGIAVNSALLLFDAARPEINFKYHNENGRLAIIACPDRGLTYPAAERVRKAMTKRYKVEDSGTILVIDGNNIPTIDSTAIKGLKSLVKQIQHEGKQIILWNWKPEHQESFIQYDRTGHDLFHHNEDITDLLSAAS